MLNGQNWTRISKLYKGNVNLTTITVHHAVVTYNIHKLKLEKILVEKCYLLEFNEQKF